MRMDLLGPTRNKSFSIPLGKIAMGRSIQTALCGVDLALLLPAAALNTWDKKSLHTYLWECSVHWEYMQYRGGCSCFDMWLRSMTFLTACNSDSKWCGDMLPIFLAVVAAPVGVGQLSTTFRRLIMSGEIVSSPVGQEMQST